MVAEIPNTPSVRLNPGQELKLAKPATELYVGQVLKTVVVKAMDDNQVMINISGQNLNAKTSHHLTPGELLQVKVASIQGETILQVLPEKSLLTSNPLQNALLQVLPKQAPATYLMATLNVLAKMPDLPVNLSQQINQLLTSITPVSQLPHQLAQAISQCGIFCEANLLNLRNTAVQKDFKGQCLRLLALLNTSEPSSFNPIPPETRSLQREILPLPGAIPQPLTQQTMSELIDQPVDDVLTLMRHQTEQVLARIHTCQLTHLLQDPEQAISLMFDLPIYTDDGVEILSLLIKEERQANYQRAVWSIQFAVNLSAMGDLQANVRLQDKTIEVQINAEQQATIELLTENQAIFQNLLSDLGLELGGWHLRHGLEENDIDASSLHLLDLRV